MMALYDEEINAERDEELAEAKRTIDAIRKVKDGYADQARFADVDAAGYFREFVRRIDAALALARKGG